MQLHAPMRESKIETRSNFQDKYACKSFRFSPVFAEWKHICCTSRVNIEQIHYKRSADIIPDTLVTVHEVELPKTINTKLGERTIWLSEVIRDLLLHSLPER